MTKASEASWSTKISSTYKIKTPPIYQMNIDVLAQLNEEYPKNIAQKGLIYNNEE